MLLSVKRFIASLRQSYHLKGFQVDAAGVLFSFLYSRVDLALKKGGDF